MEITMWKKVLMPYELAVSELTMKFQQMIEEYRKLGIYSPIERVDGRVKALSSILEKCEKKGIEAEDATKYIEDIAGIRLICQFVEDIPRVVEIIRGRRDIRVKKEDDYVRYRKDSGYRSYHMIVYYTVETVLGVQEVQAEIQIRTMAMNFWATIEHSLQYKYEGNVPENIRLRLKNSADAVLALDSEMSSIRDEVMDAQRFFSEKAILVYDILNNIQALYETENEEAMINIQNEFYELYKTADLPKLQDFNAKLDAIAARKKKQEL